VHPHYIAKNAEVQKSKVQTTCKGCDKQFISLLHHLAKVPVCKVLYPYDKMRLEPKIISTIDSDQQPMLSADEIDIDTSQNKEDKDESLHFDTTTCKGCHKDFTYLLRHLARAPQCKTLYPFEEMKIESTKKRKRSLEESRTPRKRDRKSYEDNRDPRQVRQRDRTSYEDNRDPRQRDRTSYEDNRDPRQIRQRDRTSYEDNRDPRQRERTSYEDNRGPRQLRQRDQNEYNLQRQLDSSTKQKYESERSPRTHEKKNYFLQKRKLQFLNTSEQQRHQEFSSSIKDGPTYVCTICARTLFKCGVKQLTNQTVQNLVSLSLESQPQFKQSDFAIFSQPPNNNCCICHACYTSISRLTIPKIAVANGLHCEFIPEALKLQEVEESLIATNLLFMKIVRYPTTRMAGIKDKVINVPIGQAGVSQSLNSLPRTIENAGIIQIQLKRKVQYKNTHCEGYIRPAKLHEALRQFKRLNNPHYKNIAIDLSVNYEPDVTDEDNVALKNAIELVEEEEKEYVEKDSAKKFQNSECNSTMMTNNTPEMFMIVNTSSETKKVSVGTEIFKIAPGQGRVPTSIMREEDWDTKAFPCLHPSSKYGYFHQVNFHIIYIMYSLTYSLSPARARLYCLICSSSS
jgi:hypothetical protein